ncbi:pancreatic triacylglycerol lipase-like [Andrena cerasifolii]|uniref:pancreatic triacylglycerol lipase-like n=1 Tax=Andrena cerasifolii TaxID=2819439 RepID=UPI004037C775
MVAPTPLAMLNPVVFATLMLANYTIFPDGDGAPHLIKLDYDPLTPEDISVLAANVNSIFFTLYTRRNPTVGQVIAIDDPNSVSGSAWNASTPTIMITHGWRSTGDKSSCTLVRDAYLKVFDCNVIVIDWSAISSNILYHKVAKSVPTVAEHVASFVNILRLKANLDPNNMKMIGHSLGAHVASLAARIVSQNTEVAEVVALDPAKPLFERKDEIGRVDSSHANHVQVVHTCAGRLGMNSGVGTSDFYANGGKDQPGCSADPFGICAHGRSYEYYSESVTKPRGFPGDSKSGGPQAYMGGPILDPKATGKYNFPTADHPPYAVSARIV